MSLFRKIICWLLGHRSICLFRYHYSNSDFEEPSSGYEVTYWKCERCDFVSLFLKKHIGNFDIEGKQ